MILTRRFQPRPSWTLACTSVATVLCERTCYLALRISAGGSAYNVGRAS